MNGRVFSTCGLNSKPSIDGGSIERIFKEMDNQSNEIYSPVELSQVASQATPKEEHLVEIDG